MNFGALALVGSGEYTESMLELESMLLKAASARGKNGNYVQIATAAGDESDSRVEYWKNLGREQAQKIRCDWKFIEVFDLNDALNPKWIEAIRDSALIYFSGGNPIHLYESLRDTKYWISIESKY